MYKPSKRDNIESGILFTAILVILIGICKFYFKII